MALYWDAQLGDERAGLAHMGGLGTQGEGQFPRSLFCQFLMTLRAQSRRKLLEKLSERCQGQINKEDIVKMLDDGELSQFCVEISSTLYKVKSEKFARRIGYNPRPDARPQRVDSGSGTQ